MVKVKIGDKDISLDDNTSYYEISKKYGIRDNKRAYLVKVNGVIKELRRFAKDGENIEFLYYDNEVVRDAYTRTATFILLKAINDVLGSNFNAGLKFRIYNTYYFEIENKIVSDDEVIKIKERFDEIVKEAIVIKKQDYTKKEAFKIFEEEKMEDMKLLFTYNYRPKINIRYIDSYARYINGELFYDTSYIQYYRIYKYRDGINLVTSVTHNDEDVAVTELGEKNFNVLNESVNWAKTLDIHTVGKLNRQIANNNFNHLVIMMESYQDKQIGDIAEAVKNSKKKLVFIAGPSSSGKTTFSHRLMYHLMALEIMPHPISTDNFFRNREDTPKDENGEHDYEALGAMDIDLLNDSLKRLLNGEEVDMPVFNFATGKREYKGKKLKINENEVIIMEGIHCLNPDLVPNIDQNDIFKIFISALTEVRIDNANRIATSDLRLIRRIVRDSRTRGTSAKETIKRWPSVRRGEGRSIFPYQENADIYFNSALIYEFSVLKNKALACLYELSEDDEVGIVARRLIKVLNYFLGADTDAIPRHSIIREFIGLSILEVG